MRDPRSSARYIQTSQTWLQNQTQATCALCGAPVDMTLPRTSRNGPTVEHTLPIRAILRLTPHWDEQVRLTCDQTRWKVAHKVCQDRQGQRASQQKQQHRPSRKW